jgi:hypothetical protein
MEMTTLLKLLCVCLGGVAFYLWDKEQYKKEIHTGLLTATGLLTLICMTQWGWLGLLAPAASFGIGLAAYWAGAIGTTSLQEYFAERRGIQGDIFLKMESTASGDLLLAWPLSAAAKRFFKANFGSSYPKKRGSSVFAIDHIDSLMSEFMRNRLSVTTHENMEGQMPDTVRGGEQAPYPMPIKAVKEKPKAPKVGFYKPKQLV